MGYIVTYRSYATTLSIILLAGILFSTCVNGTKDKEAIPGIVSYSAYAGSAACAGCHKAIYESHKHTAHFNTSAFAVDSTVMGNFDPGKNSFTYNNGSSVVMEKRADGFYQVAYINGVEKKKQRFDIVIGTGTKGQSFASWVNDNLVQLPVTFFTSVHQWSNSPGYPNKIAFNRPITSRCLECHATYARITSSPETEPEAFDRAQLILGVDCERCHGPAAKHITFHTQNPAETKGKFILDPVSFTRQQSLDLCRLCHGGRLQKTKPSFAFISGDALANYFKVDNSPGNTDNIDVHGNQYGLLAGSKCFQMSTTLTCVTCHDPHANEKGSVAVYSSRCTGCHNDKRPDAHVCKLTAKIGAGISNNCISCHMPEQPSMAISVLLQGSQSPTPAMMHTHLIRNYPEATKKVLASLRL